MIPPSQENPTQADPGPEPTQKARTAVQECIAGLRDLPPLGVAPHGEPFEVLVPLSPP